MGGYRCVCAGERRVQGLGRCWALKEVGAGSADIACARSRRRRGSSIFPPAPAVQQPHLQYSNLRGPSLTLSLLPPFPHFQPTLLCPGPHPHTFSPYSELRSFKELIKDRIVANADSG